jgi:hypothetical protein
MMASDRAVAQAFREAEDRLPTGCDWGDVQDYINRTARDIDTELDAATPPEGAAQGRDTERLNWLASNADRLHRHPNTGEWYVGQWHDIDTRGYPHAGVQLYESARQAIDAALATRPTPAGGST